MTLEDFLEEWNAPGDHVLVRTSGSTGQPKPMWVEKRRMEASARITCAFLGLHAGDTALLCMPLDYIAGKMMVVRALTWGLRLVAIAPSGLPHWEGHVDFAAMVPMQVWNLLHDEAGRERLMQVRHLIIGGGAIDDALAAELQTLPNHIWSTYGMTETLSHIAMRRLNGQQATEWYTPFEGVDVSLSDDQCLIVNAPAVHEGPLLTHDMAEIDGRRFRILGRRDNVICSGGIKIQAEEVERLLRPHLPLPFIITRARDAKFGQVVVLLTEDDANAAAAVCRQVLPRYWQPRLVFSVSSIPLTGTGKPARAEAESMAEKLRGE